MTQENPCVALGDEGPLPSPRMKLAMLMHFKSYVENLKDSLDSFKDEM